MLFLIEKQREKSWWKDNLKKLSYLVKVYIIYNFTNITKKKVFLGYMSVKQSECILIQIIMHSIITKRLF